MALWPTSPARGLPDTVERSSRKFQLQESYKFSSLPSPSNLDYPKQKNKKYRASSSAIGPPLQDGPFH